MCLLTVCPKGSNKYSDFLIEAIKRASVTNTDGAGFAFKRNSTKKVYISKGYTSVEELLLTIAKYKLKPEDELIIHQRIGNKGAKNTDMNHPFVLSDNKDEILQNNRYVDKPIMAHNGTISYHSKINSEMSDTYWFIQEVMYQKDVINMLKTDLIFFETLLSVRLGTNRLAFLFPNEDTDYIKIGDFKEDEGYFFSNESYKNKNIRNVGGVNHTSGFPNGHYPVPYAGIGSEDDWGDEMWDNREPATAVKPSVNFMDIVKTGNTTGKLKHASHSNDDLIINKGGLAFDDSITGIKYKLYMDMWVPDKFSTSSQFHAVRFNPTIFNYLDFIFQSVKDDKELGIVKGRYYEIIAFDMEMKREGEGIHAFARKYGTVKENSEILYIPHYQIKELFESKPCGAENIKKYFGFWKLVKELNPSKNILRNINKIMEPCNFSAEKNTKFKHVNYHKPAALSLFQLLLTKFLYPNDYKAELDKRSMVVVN